MQLSTPCRGSSSCTCLIFTYMFSDSCCKLGLSFNFCSQEEGAIITNSNPFAIPQSFKPAKQTKRSFLGLRERGECKTQVAAFAGEELVHYQLIRLLLFLISYPTAATLNESFCIWEELESLVMQGLYYRYNSSQTGRRFLLPV